LSLVSEEFRRVPLAVKWNWIQLTETGACEKQNPASKETAIQVWQICLLLHSAALFISLISSLATPASLLFRSGTRTPDPKWLISRLLLVAAIRGRVVARATFFGI